MMSKWSAWQNSYLQRWVVVFRRSLKESLAPPWRALLAVYRRMELKGTVRGRRFISGVGGEQFLFRDDRAYETEERP